MKAAPAVAITLLCCAAQAADNAMSATADGFYTAYLRLHASGGVPDKAERDKLAAYLTPGLEALLARADAAEAQLGKTKAVPPPLIPGDIFTSSFEGATSYRLGACKGDGHAGTCTAELTYDDRQDAPVRWTDTLYLVNTGEGWRIDDIGYGGTGQFSNRGRMTATLHQAIADAGG